MVNGNNQHGPDYTANEKHLVLAAIDEYERPVSIRTLGAYAESIGVKTTLLIIIKQPAEIGQPIVFSDREIRDVSSWLAKEKVTHLGFYLMTASLHPYALLVKLLRAAGYKGVIMAGGVHATLCPAESLVDGAEYAVQGPGELPLQMILNGADPASIPGLVWRRNGQIAANAKSLEQKLNVNALPFPIFRFNDRDWILADNRLRRLTWALHKKYAVWGGRYYDMLTSRGCVYRCAYCCNVNGAPVRRVSVGHAIEEIRSVKERAPGIAGINFQDDSFFAGSDEWLEEFCSRMKAEIGIPFIVRMIPRYVTKKRIQLLKSAGLEYVTMGLEGSDRVNKKIYNRQETVQSFLNAARIIIDAGIYLSTDIIINNPYEREGDLRQLALTLNVLPRSNWGVVALPLTPFPNTPLYERCMQDNLLAHFGTDPYDSMLITSRPGGYVTPRFWMLLNTQVLPSIPQELGEELITAGPCDDKASQRVEKLAVQLRRARKVTRWLNAIVPWLRPAVRHALKRVMKRNSK
ncbi:MAG: B12-binding domain-containing radical SAM protein [Planctomycetes bacterium]|nr:B12-binding domain-containing radical SAM protein [Planctomycetota bacterium]